MVGTVATWGCSWRSDAASRTARLQHLEDATSAVPESPTDAIAEIRKIHAAADSCGRHFLDGYWPAVRFDDAHDVVRVTVGA